MWERPKRTDNDTLCLEVLVQTYKKVQMVNNRPLDEYIMHIRKQDYLEDLMRLTNLDVTRDVLYQHDYCYLYGVKVDFTD